MKSEIKCTNKDCIKHAEKYGSRVYEHNGVVRCERCGGVYNGEQFILKCKKCGKETDKLYGLFVPHNCRECQDEARKIAEESNDRCFVCGALRMDCCC